MRLASKLMRWVLPAALILAPTIAVADVSARIDEATGDVVVIGLTSQERQAILEKPGQLRLQVDGSTTSTSMLVNISEQADALHISPRFPLRPSTKYRLSVAAPGAKPFVTALALEAPESNAPVLIGFAPAQAVIPANTLRLYLSFSEPMARGQLRESIKLVRRDGREVENPFLNLDAELWDASQTRLTLLFDPGRIKQGVGPNMVGGAPLEPGESYRLIVASVMQSAEGTPIGQDIALSFRVGEAERRAIDPAAWSVSPPTGKRASLSIAFDRIMDSGAVVRLIRLHDPQGNRVKGQISTDGGGWTFTPTQPWSAGTYELVIDPALEDVSGNTIRAPFDARTGTMGQAIQIPKVQIHIAASNLTQELDD